MCISLIVQVGCGKKPKNILNFETIEKQRKKTRHIFYPTVKNGTLTLTNLGMKLSWKPVEHKDLMGYNVYRFSHTTFIAKTPLNKAPLSETEYVDLATPKTYIPHYVIRAVFKTKKQQLEGPASQIIFLS